VSAVEQAVEKVKKLSPKQARELLVWLAAHESIKVHKPSTNARKRRRRKSPTKEELKQWHESVRLTTDWEPPRMPDGYLKPFVL
jgi:hypothetical protein